MSHLAPIVKTMKNHTQSKGFTLVELAIVMIIIGLLIGGILKGQELIINAQINSTVAQFKGILTAHHTFKDIYRYPAGDLPAGIANSRIPNCPISGCLGGNGNNSVGNRLGSAQDINAIENIEYWKHLALTDMITGVDPNAPTAPAGAVAGFSNPVADIGGVWNAFTPNAASTVGYTDKARGTMLEIAAHPRTRGATTTPSIASKIDRKLDDGMPNTGDVAAEFRNQGCDNGELATSNYQTVDVVGCIIYFVMD